MKDTVKTAQVRVNRVSPSYWRVVMNNPPLEPHGAGVRSAAQRNHE